MQLKRQHTDIADICLYESKREKVSERERERESYKGNEIKDYIRNGRNELEGHASCMYRVQHNTHARIVQKLYPARE